MVYKLELPTSSHIHAVFHVSCIKKVIGDKILIQTIFLDLDEEGKVILEPKKIYERRIKKLRTQIIIEYLIKWKNLLVENSTWEDDSFIHKQPQITNL